MKRYWWIVLVLILLVLLYGCLTGPKTLKTSEVKSDPAAWEDIKNPVVALPDGPVPAPPIKLPPGLSGEQKVVVEFIQKLGVMPPVPTHSGETPTETSSVLEDGDAELKKVTTRSFQTIRAIDDILTLVNRPEIYPGALIQGKSLFGGRPIKLAVQKGKRAPLTYVLLGATPADAKNIKENGLPDQKAAGLPAKEFHELFRSAVAMEPDMASAEKLRMQLMADLKVPAHFSKNLTYAYSSEHLNTQLNVTANFFSGSAGMNVKTSTDSKHAVVLLLLRQEFFKIAVDPPTVGEWFTRDIKTEDFDPGNIGEKNNPCFVSSVGYGRLVCVMVESAVDHDKLEAALNFAYSSGFTSVKGDASADLTKTLETATYRIMVYGGDPSTTPQSSPPPQVQDLRGPAGLAELEKLCKPDFNPQFALPISYEICNLWDKAPVAIASASAHQLVDAVSSPYQYQIRIDKFHINKTFRSFLGFGIGHQDGEFHLEAKDGEKKLGVIDRTLDEGDAQVNDHYATAPGARGINLEFALRERDNAKGSHRVERIDLAEVRKAPGHSKSYGPVKFEAGNEVYFTVTAIPPLP